MTAMPDKVRDTVRSAIYSGTGMMRTFRPEDALVVVSDPRGGSTWLAQTLEEATRAAVVWEPLTIGKVPEVKEIGFTRRQYIPQGASWPEAERVMDRILRGRLLSPFICSHSGLRRFVTAERLLVKFCRAQALLPWLTDRYEFRQPPVYMIRHPFAVAASQMAHGGWSLPELRFSVVDGRFGEAFAEQRPYLESLTHLDESLVATWCTANLIPLRHPRHGTDWIPVHYENLLMDPGGALQRLFARLGLELPAAALDEVRNPSWTSKDPRFVHSRSEQLQKWRNAFSPEQIERMQAVLHHYGIVEYSADNPMPRGSGELSEKV